MRDTRSNRRSFLMQTAGTAAAAGSLNLMSTAHAAGTDTLKVGLVGCGGRGTGAAEQTLTGDPNVRLVAVADAFKDRLDEHLSQLKGNGKIAGQVDVPADRQYVGFDAYKAVIDQVDLVVLATPPGFRPIHFAYAVSKNVHAFIEKPMAVDGPGLRMFLDAAKKSKEKGLSAVNGFCWRYFNPRRELMKRVFDGQIGEITAIETTYNSPGVWEPRRTRGNAPSEMEYQMRNWYYYDWLSGDHIVEQAVHGIDTMGWAMKDEPPIQCFGVGGRQARTDAKYGNIYDHFSVVFEYPNNVRGYHQCRHWPNTPGRVKDYILGTKGVADVFAPSISGANRWRTSSSRGKENMYQNEHDEMYVALRAGKPINNAEQAAHSTRLAIMARMAAYTGSVVTWDEALQSKESLSPSSYTWGDAPMRPVPVPGTAKLV